MGSGYWCTRSSSCFLLWDGRTFSYAKFNYFNRRLNILDIVQQRIDELEAMRNRLEINQEKDGTWDWFLDIEIEQIKNARHARRTLNLRNRLKSLVVSIVAYDSSKRKGAGA